jgi:hypothetical protein
MVLLYNRLLFRSYNDLLYKITDTKKNRFIYAYKSKFDKPIQVNCRDKNSDYSSFQIMHINNKISEINLKDLSLNQQINNYEELENICSSNRINHIYIGIVFMNLKNIPSSVKKLIELINNHIKTKCKELSISFDYGYKLNKILDNEFMLSQLCLCLSYNDICISRTICQIEDDTLTIDIRTDRQHRNKKYNILLNSIAIIICKKFKLKQLFAYSVNPITVYMLVRHFQTEYDKDFDKFINNRKITLDLCNEYFNKVENLDVYVPITDENVQKAIQLYQDLIEPDSNLKCP